MVVSNQKLTLLSKRRRLQQLSCKNIATLSATGAAEWSMTSPQAIHAVTHTGRESDKFSHIFGRSDRKMAAMILLHLDQADMFRFQ
jgi:hypothetical protein